MLSLAFLRQRLDLIGHKADVTAPAPAAWRCWPRFGRASSRAAPCSASDLRPNLPRGVPGDKIHDPHSDRARPVVCRHSSYGRRDEGEGRHRITRGSRIASSRVDRQLAEKALHAKAKFKLKSPELAEGSHQPSLSGPGGIVARVEVQPNKLVVHDSTIPNRPVPRPAPPPDRAAAASEQQPCRCCRSREPGIRSSRDIQTDCANLHVDGSPHVIRLRRTTLWHLDAGSGRRPTTSRRYLPTGSVLRSAAVR